VKAPSNFSYGGGCWASSYVVQYFYDVSTVEFVFTVRTIQKRHIQNTALQILKIAGTCRLITTRI
jgi:hypothetical protein